MHNAHAFKNRYRKRQQQRYHWNRLGDSTCCHSFAQRVWVQVCYQCQIHWVDGMNHFTNHKNELEHSKWIWTLKTTRVFWLNKISFSYDFWITSCVCTPRGVLTINVVAATFRFCFAQKCSFFAYVHIEATTLQRLNFIYSNNYNKRWKKYCCRHSVAMPIHTNNHMHVRHTDRLCKCHQNRACMHRCGRRQNQTHLMLRCDECV